MADRSLYIDIRKPNEFFTFAEVSLRPIVIKILSGADIDKNDIEKYYTLILRELYLGELANNEDKCTSSALRDLIIIKTLLYVAYSYLDVAKVALNRFSAISMEDKHDIFQDACIAFNNNILSDLNNNRKKKKSYFYGIVINKANDFLKIILKSKDDNIQQDEIGSQSHILETMDIKDLLSIKQNYPVSTDISHISKLYDLHILRDISLLISDSCKEIFNLLSKNPKIKSPEMAEKLDYSNSYIRNKKKECVDKFKLLWEQHTFTKFSTYGYKG